MLHNVAGYGVIVLGIIAVNNLIVQDPAEVAPPRGRTAMRIVARRRRSDLKRSGLILASPRLVSGAFYRLHSSFDCRQ